MFIHLAKICFFPYLILSTCHFCFWMLCFTLIYTKISLFPNTKNGIWLLITLCFPLDDRTHSPWWGELHMGIKKSCHLSSGYLPTLDPGPDQSLSLLVPYNLHQAGIAFVHILLQWTFQLLYSSENEDNTSNKTSQKCLWRLIFSWSLNLQFSL